jgi:hypothetical protein
MPWKGLPGFPYTREAILRDAPSVSGVYLIYNATSMIYVGETSDIRARLLNHAHGDNVCINVSFPTTWSFEPADTWSRLTRRNELILELRPLCNRPLD